MRSAGEGPGGAGQVERHGGEDEPGAVRGEAARGQVRQSGVLQVGEDRLDDRVLAVDLVGVDGRQVAGGEERVEPPDVEQAGLVRVGGGVDVGDPAHHESAGHVVGLARGGERGETDLGDLCAGDPRLAGVVEDGLRVVDRGPRVGIDLLDGVADRGVLAHGDAHLRAGLDRGQDRRATVVGGVGAQQHHPGRLLGAQPAHGGQGIGGDPGRPAGGARRALPQPGRHDHRCGLRGGDGRGGGVQAAHAGVSEPGAGLGVAMDLDDRVVEVHQRQVVDPGEDRRRCGEAPQEPGGDCVELAHVPERERPQERPQGAGRVRAVEGPAHPAVAQDRHVVDAVCPRQHSRHQARDLQAGVRALVRGHAQMRAGQRAQASRLGQRHQRDQARGRHQVRVIEQD